MQAANTSTSAPSRDRITQTASAQPDMQLQGREKDKSGTALTQPNAIYDAYRIDPKTEIRSIQTFDSGSPDDQIWCNMLIQRPIEESYVAISYTWGGTAQAEHIMCSGFQVPVTKNCHDVLRTLRSSADSSLVWIDALCIDQQDVSERSIQVARIGDIFHSAKKVIVYPGREYLSFDVISVKLPFQEYQDEETMLSHSKYVEEWIADCAQESAGKRSVTTTENLSERDKQARLESAYLNLQTTLELVGAGVVTSTERCGVQHLDDGLLGVKQRWRSLQTTPISRKQNAELRRIEDLVSHVPKMYAKMVFRSPWWTRTWVMQEVMLARRLLIFLGGSTMYNLNNILWRFRKSANLPYTARLQTDVWTEYGEASAHTRHMNLNFWRLFERMESTRQFGCQDPRDRLFAILPLFLRPLPQILRPDYSKTVDEVFTDLTWFFINYDMPESMSYAGVSQTLNGCPSKVTDWSFQGRSSVLRDYGKPELTKDWRAGFPRDNRRILARRDKRTLIVRGILSKEISSVGSFPTLQSKFLRTVRSSIQNDEDVAHILSAFGDVTSGNDSSEHDDSTSVTRIQETSADEKLLAGLRAWFSEAIPLCRYRRTFVAVDGSDGLGPLNVQQGDYLCILLGYPTPFVIRKEDPGWLLIGGCLVDGMMHGQLVDTFDWSEAESKPAVPPFQDFEIH